MGAGDGHRRRLGRDLRRARIDRRLARLVLLPRAGRRLPGRQGGAERARPGGVGAEHARHDLGPVPRPVRDGPHLQGTRAHRSRLARLHGHDAEDVGGPGRVQRARAAAGTACRGHHPLPGAGPADHPRGPAARVERQPTAGSRCAASSRSTCPHAEFPRLNDSKMFVDRIIDGSLVVLQRGGQPAAWSKRRRASPPDPQHARAWEETSTIQTFLPKPSATSSPPAGLRSLSRRACG